MIKANQTEQEMRDCKVPEFKKLGDVTKYINDLLKRPHDYGTAAYATSLSATAVFSFVASKLGITGFQASCAAKDILRRTTLIDGPFVIVPIGHVLYPQYDLHQDLDRAIAKCGEWLGEEARKKLSGDISHAHPEVVERWKQLAAAYPSTAEEGK